MDEILESHEGRRGSEGDVTGAPFAPGRAGAGFGGVAADSAGCWALPFCDGEEGVGSIETGGRD